VQGGLGGLGALALLTTVALAGLTPTQAWAGPRDDMKAAYDNALVQANNLEYDAALGIINAAISTAESNGNANDPVLASLYLLRAALTFSAQGNGAAAQISADLKRAVSLNYYVVVPIEMRSDDLSAYMQQARSSSGAAAPAPITLTPPAASCGAPLHLEVLLSVPDGGQAALYWRKAGSGSEFVGAEMPTFSNVAEVDIPADQHGDANIEYFIYAFDASGNPAANLGLQDSPMTLEQDCGSGEPEVPVVVAEEPKPKAKAALPRVWINIGVGTGFFPRGAQEYGPAESGCAIARWVAGTRDVSAVPAAELVQAFDTFGAPGTTASMMAAFNPTECAEHHPVSTGFASSGFHLAPEVSVRIGKRFSLGVFGRLQLLTGAKLFRDDPSKPLQQSFVEDVYSDMPAGVKQKVPFTFAVGVKFKAFLGKDHWKFRPVVGAYAGGGFARLRVNMGFANDRNGNSVPDNQEIGFDTDISGACFPVWPYNDACTGANMTADNNKAAAVSTSPNNADSRIDVVTLGPFFIGPLVGFNYQIHKNFALFGELGLGVWLPSTTSLLIDLTVGPAITF
jgi:hypothetical protein